MTDFQFRLWIYLITYVDDYGRGSADPELLKGLVFPRMKRVREQDIASALAELAGKGAIHLYEVDGESLFYFPNWSEHQRIQTKRSKFPDPPKPTELPANQQAETEIHGDSPWPTVNHGYNPIQSESESEVEVRTREDATTSDDILSISPSEADAWRQDMAALEDAARGIGLPVQMHDLELLNTLRGDYGTEWVLQAIKRTQYRNRTWGVVCGILRSWKQNGGIDDGIGRKPGGNDPQAGRAGRSYNLRDEIL